jgi:hypothetical protein
MTYGARGHLPLVAALALASVAREAAAECDQLGAPIVDHSCFHARLGPFADVAARPSERPASGNLDEVHTFYRVALGDAQAAPVAVPYTPARSGAWAIYVEHDVPVTVRAPGGAAIAVTNEGVVVGCPHFARVRTVTLAAGARYEVELGPTTASEVGIVLEKLADFAAIHGRDRDGDGFGDPLEIVTTPCAPSPGFVANDRDCDDRDARTYPGAPELCGGPDRNCNGTAGDAGAPCRAGVGACAVPGVSSCPQAGGPPSCSARASAPRPEACDGIDEDCDGLPDPGEPEQALLCTDPAAPRCVPTGTGASACGCEVDADCGGPASARICWLRGTEQRCLDGCIDGFGRNGCPVGLRCSSADPAQPGVCVPGEVDATGCGCRTGGDSLPGAALTCGLALWLVGRPRRAAARQPRRAASSL